MMKPLLALLVCAMSGIVTQPKPDPSETARTLAQPYAQFGFDLLRELSASHRNVNIFVSPSSIAIALAMTANGANGPTRDAILKVLHSDGQSIETLNAANQSLVEQISKTSAVQLSMANALWLQQGFPVEASFKHVLHTAYSAQAENVDFHNPSAVETINSWVAQHTNDRIQKLLEQIDPSTVTILTNAVAFKGKWTSPFDVKDTQPHDFTSFHQQRQELASSRSSITEPKPSRMATCRPDVFFAIPLILLQERSLKRADSKDFRLVELKSLFSMRISSSTEAMPKLKMF